jgi:hypothetical protein
MSHLIFSECSLKDAKINLDYRTAIFGILNNSQTFSISIETGLDETLHLLTF